MADKVKPLKMESSVSGGTEDDMFPHEADPSEDYLSAKGLAFNGLNQFITGGSSSPVGIDLEPGATYIQYTSGGFVLWNKFDTGVNDWRQITASDIAFANTGGTFDSSSNEVESAINEIRAKAKFTIGTHVTTLNGTAVLTTANQKISRITGSATGFSVQLPDATTLSVGRRFEIVNESSETILVTDDGGTTIATLISGDDALFTLEENSDADGLWLAVVTSSAATGITSYVLETSTPFTTSSTTDVIITGFTVTPVSGRYALLFSSDLDIAQNNKLAQCVVFIGGTADEGTRKTVQGVSSNFNTSFYTQGEIEVNGAQAVDIRVNVDGGSIDLNARSLFLIRLGA